MSAYIRYIKCLAATRGDPIHAKHLAAQQYGPSSDVVRLFEKALVVTTADMPPDPDFASAGRQIIELVRKRSLIGKVADAFPFRKVPFNTHVMAQSSAPTASWTAEGQLIQTTSTAWEREFLNRLKLDCLAPLTDESVKGQGADFESMISRDLVRAIAELEGSSFIDPANAGVANQKPASVTNGLTPVTGTADPKIDVDNLIDGFAGDLETAVMVARPKDGIALQASGYINAGARGGDVAGIPLVTSTAVPAGVVALVDPAGILLADGGVTLDMSDQTTIHFGPDSNDEYTVVSLFQENLVAVLAQRYLNWKTVRTGAVSYISGATW
ncbi:phage major capsid protein [Cupriavidus taiwanensis]|uniref:HK97 family phage major capsid protein n=1 Tax=Cupriavidus taiwanensis TaxID=164546 RepID=A0A375J6R1_9BURK|nr:phage major capsid protein [Cupriavidus taiwanensis]SPR99306.1 HK97 family phage major capsid protein [Cupriavidus taiwanensis]